MYIATKLQQITKNQKFPILKKQSFNPDISVYNINGYPNKTTLQHKDLGITFTADLNWTEHLGHTYLKSCCSDFFLK